MTDGPEVVLRPADGVHEYEVYGVLPPEAIEFIWAELPEQIVGLFTVIVSAAHAPEQNTRASAMTAATLKVRASQDQARPSVGRLSFVLMVHPSLCAGRR